MTDTTILDKAAVEAEIAVLQAELAAERFGPLRGTPGSIDTDELDAVRTLQRRVAQARQQADIEHRHHPKEPPR